MLRWIWAALALWMLVAAGATAQIVVFEGQVLDAKSGEGVAFAKVTFAGSKRGTLTDVDGRFRLMDQAADSLVISSLGYEPLVLLRPAQTLGVLRLVPREIRRQDVVLRAYDSAAVAIIRRAIANREANDPERSPGFSYRSYNRLGVSVLERGRKLGNLEYEFVPDSALPVIPLESVTERKFGGSARRNVETVEGAQIIGLPGLSFGLVSSNLQDFSFYRDRVELLGLGFVSPLHVNALNLYWFTLRDSLPNDDGTTTYIIDYVPRAKGENAFRGFIQLRSPHYALTIVQAELRPMVNAVGIERGQIQQVYQQAGAQGRWFPYQYAMDLRLFPQGTPPDQRLRLVGRSYLRDIRWEVPADLPRRPSAAIVIAANAADRDSAFWASQRPFALSDDEARVAQLLDSARREAPFLTTMLRQSEFLVQGEIAIGKISLDLSRMAYLYNRVEGLRPSLALTTNTRFSQRVRIGGYGAFGVLDGRWKYGGSLRWMPTRLADRYVGLSFQDDLFETGGGYLNPTLRRGLHQPQMPDPLRGLFLNRMDYRRRWQVDAATRLLPGLTGAAFLRTDEIQVQELLRETLPGIVRVAESGVTLRFAPGEQVVRQSGVPVVVKSGQPLLWARATRGLQTGSSPAWDYWKWEAALSWKVDLHRFGALLLQGSAHQLDGEAPYANAFTLPGMLPTETSRTALENGYAFATLPVQGLAGTRMALGTATYRLPVRIGKPTSLVQPILYGVHRSGWTRLATWAEPQAALRGQTDAPQGLHESGLIVTGLMDRLPSPFNLQVALGALYRHGPYASDDSANNVFFTFGVTQRF